MTRAVAEWLFAWAAATADFVTRVLRGITWRTLAIAHALGLIWFALPMLWGLTSPSGGPLKFPVSIAVISELSVIFMLPAILAAQEAVRRGAWRSIAFPVALLLGAACTSFTQWHVRAALNLYTGRHRPDIPLALQRTQMLFFGFDLLIHAGLVTLIYVNRQRDLEVMRAARAAELTRARTEQHLVQLGLATTLAEVAPEELFAGLSRIQRLLAGDSPSADEELEAFTRDLRTRLGASNAAASQPGVGAAA